MNLIGIIGLAALLLIAYLMSFQRSKVRLRPVFWGIGLQFLFSLIILRQDYFSFVGMGILGLFIITFILREEEKKVGGGVAGMVAVVGASLVAGFLLHFLNSTILLALIGMSLAFMIVNTNFKFSAVAQKYVGCLFVILGIVYFFVNNLTGQVIFSNFSNGVAYFLSLADFGSRFLFSNLADPSHFFPGAEAGWPGFGFQFAFKVLPTIIFFGGFMSILYYLGVMQKVIEGLSKFMQWTIGTSGAETLSCTANIFVGQTEAPLLIKPFLEDMTKSELTTIMVGGFATIAGGVLAGYIAMGVPAGHLVAASVMSAPAALVVGKIIFPETEHSKTAGEVELPHIETGGNILEAASNGITDGLKLAVNVGAMLIGFIALIAVLDASLNYLDSLIDGKLLGGTYAKYATAGMSPATGEYAGWFPGSLQTLFGTALRPLAYLMGVSWEHADKVGNLLGIKLSLNEFVAYGTLGDYIQNNALDERAKVISTYALCGFANFSSIGIQIGGIAAICPKRRSDLASVGFRAMCGGVIASWLTATIAGILL